MTGFARRVIFHHNLGEIYFTGDLFKPGVSLSSVDWTNKEEYNAVLEDINKTLTVKRFYEQNKLMRINNPYLWGYYQLKKLEYQQRGIPFEELTLYHETDASSVDSITKDNFDWRRCSRQAPFGEGVCFSPFAAFARMHSRKKGALLVVSVLVGKCQPGRCDQEIPDKEFDTTTNGGKIGCNVYVKYSDNEFYPKYVLYFDESKVK